MGKYFNKQAKAKSKIEILKKYRRPLTPEERVTTLKAKAVWHYSLPNHEPTPAVWKSVNPHTKQVTYVTNTHRAYATASTLKGAISRFHKFIKGTA